MAEAFSAEAKQQLITLCAMAKSLRPEYVESVVPGEPVWS